MLTKFVSKKGEKQVIESDHNVLSCQFSIKVEKVIPQRREVYNMRNKDNLRSFNPFTTGCVFKNVPREPGNSPIFFTKLCRNTTDGKIRFSVSFLVSFESSFKEEFFGQYNHIFHVHFRDEKTLVEPLTYIYVVGLTGVPLKTRIYTWLGVKGLSKL